MPEVKFCPNCGKQVRPAINYCISCGYDLTRIMDASDPVTDKSNLPRRPQPLSERDEIHPLKCPMCLRVDRVAKVSAIVSSGTVEGTSSGSTWGVGRISGLDNTIDIQSQSKYSVQAQSLLSQRINFWSKTAHVDSLDFQIGILWVGGVVAGLVFQALWLSAAIIIAVFIFGVTVFNPMKKRARKETEAARLRWEKLYYCARDDVAFDPEASVPVRPEQIRNYIYR